MYSMKDRERLSSNGHSGSAPTRPKNRVVGISGYVCFLIFLRKILRNFGKWWDVFRGYDLLLNSSGVRGGCRKSSVFREFSVFNKKGNRNS